MLASVGDSLSARAHINLVFSGFIGMSSTRHPALSGLLLAAAGAIAFSGKAIIVKLSYRYGVDAVTVIMYRMLLALPFFLLLGWWSERQTFARDNPLSKRDVMGIVALGFVGYYLSSYLDFLGLQYITASLERLILYLNPTLVVLLGWLLFKKQIQPIRMLAMGVSYSGVLLVFAHELSFAGTDVVLGSSLVFASALTYAVYLIYSGQLVQRVGAMRLVGWATSVACVCCIVQFLVLRPFSAAVVPTEVLWLAGLNALACTVAPVLMVMMAIERIGAALTAQTGMIGPMATIALGVLLLDEPLNVWIGLGTLLVLSGVYIVSKYGAK
jgi:drug/metabolite transporter (DMT)-like permease